MQRISFGEEIQADGEPKRSIRDVEEGERGAEEGFLNLFEQHKEALVRYCRFLTGSAPEAEDLLQETWMKAWFAFREKKNAWNRTYLRSIAYHVWIDRQRKAQHEARPDIRTENETGELFDPLRLWSAAERLIRILTPDQRTVYLLMEYMRFTAAETADLMRTTEGGVKASLHRARKKLDAYRQQEHARSDSKKSVIGPHDEQAIYAYMEAIRLQDVRALLVLWNGGTGEEASLAVRCAGAVRPARARGVSQPQTPRMSAVYSGYRRSSLRLRRAA
ncbi:hypothetical protein CDO73_25250 [Saccharibacillus sp. O23]|uniref:RNA polymerase sigma factor n=1 Tax=Saccharibacillus sp. O23 TaxID=2009338 RepID=UPI000B4E5867|nr:RNA polymerase sigma factor [Saccharibacillus sp. O23]OWR26696.1 hypothetical protein CDO73_25250 [Saccharibacillus sp. O23]